MHCTIQSTCVHTPSLHAIIIIFFKKDVQDILIFFPSILHRSTLSGWLSSTSLCYPSAFKIPAWSTTALEAAHFSCIAAKKKKKEWLGERCYAKAGEVAMRIHNLTAEKRSVILPNRPCDVHTVACKQKQISEYSFSLALETA